MPPAVPSRTEAPVFGVGLPVEAGPAAGAGPSCAPAALWTARAGDRVTRRNSSRTARSSGCWCHSGCICAPVGAGAKTRIAARRAASVLRSCAPRWPALAGRRWPAAKRTEAPRTAWWAGQVRRAARAGAAQPARRARGLAVASARRQPLRLKSGDSRSPDRTSVTPGFLCRSGYTSPTIAQSLVPRFQYFKQGAE